MHTTLTRSGLIIALTLAWTALPAQSPDTAGKAASTVEARDSQNEDSMRYIRYSVGDAISYGTLDGETIHQLDGDLFDSPKPTGVTHALADVEILPPCEPSKVIAVGLNYKSHIGGWSGAEYPGLFTKFPTSIIAHEQDIVIPTDGTNIHYEGEMVLVIGKRAKNVSVERALDHVFGATVGNDVSERRWQGADLQWFRAKASDTFGPLGPTIVTGLNYDDLLLETRVNGETRQSQRTADLIFNCSEIVSYISRYVTLVPGDVIYTGTPGSTRSFQAGDVIEIELEGVGILRNRAVAASERN